MSGSPNIQYLTRQQINIEKWDQCIGTADNGNIYTYSFYLDIMSQHWDALVLSKGLHSENDYEAVMPLTWNKKMGIRYLYQPFLTAQLGVFGKNITPAITDNFIQSIPASFRFIDILLNSNNFSADPNTVQSQKNNYILALNKPYGELYQQYRENIQRNIKKAGQLGCTVQKDIDAEKVIGLAVAQMKSQGHSVTENIERFRKLYTELQRRKMAATYGVFSSQHELLASCIFSFSHNRAYYILVGNHPASKNTGASHALIDAFIKEHAEKKMLLDFEGSDIPSLALFYSSFGAVNEVYPALRINRLPFYLRWMKR